MRTSPSRIIVQVIDAVVNTLIKLGKHGISRGGIERGASDEIDLVRYLVSLTRNTMFRRGLRNPVTSSPESCALQQ